MLLFYLFNCDFGFLDNLFLNNRLQNLNWFLFFKILVLILLEIVLQQLPRLLSFGILNNFYPSLNRINHLYMIIGLINPMLNTNIEIFWIYHSVSFP